jgi:hypothetical protein
MGTQSCSATESLMTRLSVLGPVSLVALACATLPACGQQDETQRILTQCANPAAPEALDSCIEQTRVQLEADPSPELKTLLANLTKQEAGARNQPRSLQPLPPAPGDDGVATGDDALPPPSSDLDSAPADEPPPDMPPQDVAPPPQQGSPADADQGDTDTPPAPPPPDSGQTPRQSAAGQDGHQPV